jgi:MFS family permease
VTDDAVATAEEVTAAASLDDEEHKLAKLLLAESREELTRADGKASLLLAALGIGLSAILGAMLGGDWTPFVLVSPWELIWWVGAGLAGVSLISLCVAVWPRVTHDSGQSGVTYFGEAARFETVGELTAALKRTETDPVARTVLQLHVISRRADQKYAAIRVGLVVLGLAIALTLAAVLGDHFS